MWPFLIAFVVSAPEPAPLTADDTAGRTEVRGQRYDPPPTAIIARDRIDETANGDLASVLDGEPGLTLSRLGGLGAFSTLAIRGSSPEQVLVVLDGIPLNPADGTPVDLATLPLGPLQSIDVHRGRVPWSLGVSGLGGALVLHTRVPQETTADAQLALGSFETASLRGYVGVPLGALTLAFAVDALHTDADFSFANDNGTAWTTSDDHRDTRRNADVDQLTAFGRADVTLDDVRLSLVAMTTWLDRGLPSLAVTPTRASRFALSRQLAALHLEAFGPLLVSATAWLATSDSSVRDPLGEIGLGAGEATVTSVVPGATLTLRYPMTLGGWKLTPSVHASWHLEATTAETRIARHIAAGALELLAKRAHWELSGGVRVESDVEHTSLAAFIESATTLDTLRVILGTRVAPRLPSLFELHGDTGLALGNPALTPETASTLELGARWDPAFADHAWSFAAFAYATWATDLIQFIQNAQGVSRPENLAAARILGAELSAEGRLGWLYLRSALTLMDTTDTSDVAARHGNALPLRPTLATSHRLELRVADAILGDARGATGLYLELDYVAGNHLDPANLVAVPARTLLGAGAYVRGERAEVMLSLSNLLSDRVQDLAGYPLPGLTAMLSLRLTSAP